MKAFIYHGRTYLRIIPGKMLFRSTMVHEVVNRGDVFAMDCDTQVLTIIPGTAEVEHLEIYAARPVGDGFVADLPDTKAGKAVKNNAIARLRAVRDKLHEGKTLEQAIKELRTHEQGALL